MTRIPIIERTTEQRPGDGRTHSAFRRRHPIFVYVFEDTAKGFYIVGCLALDLFLPIQLQLMFAGQEAVTLMIAVAMILGLAYGELRFYRRIWPPKRSVAESRMVEHEES